METKTTHTKGPWTYREDSETKSVMGTPWVVYAPKESAHDGAWLAIVQNSPAKYDYEKDCAINGEDNARLISASPELLEVVLAFVGASRYAGDEGVQQIAVSPWLIDQARKALAKAEGR